MALKAVKPKAKKAVTPVITADDIGLMAKEYAELSAQIKVLEERKKDLSAKIKEGAIGYGVKDDKGSSYLNTFNGYIVGNVSKVSMTLNHEKGAEFLEAKGLGDLIDIVTVKTINEERLEKAVGENRLSVSDVESFTDKKQSYQVSVKCVDEMPEVEQGNLAMAAKRK